MSELMYISLECLDLVPLSKIIHCINLSFTYLPYLEAFQGVQELFRKVNKMRKCKLWMAFTAVEGDINSFTFILELVAAYKNENIYVWKPWKVLYKEFSVMLSVTFTLCIILSRVKKVQLSKDLFSYWHCK